MLVNFRETHLREQLRRVTQAVSAAEGKQNILEVIVSEVCRALDIEVCSIYLADYRLNQFVLTASRGLDLGHSTLNSLDFNQGLVGLIGQREEPIYLSDVKKSHPYTSFPLVNEDDFNAFLGVPVIHQRKVLGVLVIQAKQPRRFDLDEETFLTTLAAQLSSKLASSEFETSFEQSDSEFVIRTMQGIPVSSGVAVGKARVVFPLEDIHSVPDRKTDDIADELNKLELAVKITRDQLEGMSQRMQGLVSSQELSLFDAYQQILGAEGLASEVEEQIRLGYWAATALRIVTQRHLNAFKSMQDPYLRERANDIEDLANRLLSHLVKANKRVMQFEPDTVIVADKVSAAMLAELPVSDVVGIVSLTGSSTSHAAILAKALGIPAIMGLESFPIKQMENRSLIVDGYNGQVYLSPGQSLINQYQALIKEEVQLANELVQDETLPNTSRDGSQVNLLINSSLATDTVKARGCGADGIGLYRTEIPFMQLDQFPSEDVQSVIYSDLLREFHEFPVTIRTLDIGGDKQLSYFPISEDNPFLGWRGIRVTLDHPEIFLVQLRAIFKASVHNQQLRLAIPMVSTLEELDESLRFIHQAFDEVSQELAESGVSIRLPLIGLILEVPAAVFQLSDFATRVDFISVGTNDLIQYMMAVDRNNLRVKNLYSHFQPAVLKVLTKIVQECEGAGISMQICGEMAADPLAAILLIGMGFSTLSMDVSCIARVKRAISRFDMDEMQKIAKSAANFETEAKVRDYLLKAMEDKGLGGLVRAGN